MGNQHQGEIIHLATAPSEVEGLMWANAIRAEGISVMVRPGGLGAGGWASSATFEHALYVREADFEDARDILERFMDESASSRSVARARRAAPKVRPRSLRRPG